MTKPWRAPRGVIIRRRRSSVGETQKWQAKRAELLKAAETALQTAAGPERARLLILALNLCGGLPYWLHLALRRELVALAYPALPEPEWVRWNMMQALVDQGVKQKEAKVQASEILRGTEHAAGPEMILKDFKKINRRLGLQRRYWRKG
jgi:hypothetical protein